MWNEYSWQSSETVLHEFGTDCCFQDAPTDGNEVQSCILCNFENGGTSFDLHFSFFARILHESLFSCDIKRTHNNIKGSYNYSYDLIRCIEQS